MMNLILIFILRWSSFLGNVRWRNRNVWSVWNSFRLGIFRSSWRSNRHWMCMLCPVRIFIIGSAWIIWLGKINGLSVQCALRSMGKWWGICLKGRWMSMWIIRWNVRGFLLERLSSTTILDRVSAMESMFRVRHGQGICRTPPKANKCYNYSNSASIENWHSQSAVVWRQDSIIR